MQAELTGRAEYTWRAFAPPPCREHLNRVSVVIPLGFYRSFFWRLQTSVCSYFRAILAPYEKADRALAGWTLPDRLGRPQMVEILIVSGRGDVFILPQKSAFGVRTTP